MGEKPEEAVFSEDVLRRIKDTTNLETTAVPGYPDIGIMLNTFRGNLMKVIRLGFICLATAQIRVGTRASGSCSSFFRF
jgi:hypothetical protein